MIYALGCHCGNTDTLIRNFLHRVGYPEALSIRIYKGKEASRKLAQSIRAPGAEMLDSFLRDASKWAVVLGFDPETGECRWSDIAHGGDKSRIEAEFVVERFA